MLARIVVAASLTVFVATQAPAMFASSNTPNLAAVQAIATQALSPPAKDAALRAGGDGHFSGQFVINGRRVEGVIDTGATFVALGEATAQGIGIDPYGLVYDYTVATAAGDVKAARVTLSSLTIDGVSVKDVDALVVRNRSLSVALIGMSFLGRLSSYAVAGDVMRLVE